MVHVDRRMYLKNGVTCTAGEQRGAERTQRGGGALLPAVTPTLSATACVFFPPESTADFGTCDLLVSASSMLGQQRPAS